MSNKENRKEEVLSESSIVEWRCVNADNEFIFDGFLFVVDESVEEYRIYNKYDKVEDYTNESIMDEILISLNLSNEFKFYNQNYEEIDSNLITLKKRLK